MNNQNQTPANAASSAIDNITYNHILELPIYQSSVKNNWFTRGKDNFWYYIQTDIYGVSKQFVLFNIDLTKVQIIDPDPFGRFRYLIVDYYCAGLTLLSTVIPFDKFMNKKIKQYFFIPAGFRIADAKDNVINEFLFFLITNCPNMINVFSYGYQGWNLDSNDCLVFECENRYDEVFKSYLPPSVLMRSNKYPYGYSEHLISNIFNVLSNTWEVKLLLAMRISSLMLYFTYANSIHPKQFFIIESSNDINSKFISDLLKTNNAYDNDPLSLELPQNKLLTEISNISDGMALLYDLSSENSANSISLSCLSNLITKNACNISSSQQLIAIITQYSRYDIDPESYYSINFDSLYLTYNYANLKELLLEIDSAIISHFEGRSFQEAVNEYCAYLSPQINNAPLTLPNEFKDTYYMINTAMSFFNKLLYDMSQQKPGTFFNSICFDQNDIFQINCFLMTIDRSGQNKTQKIIDNFSNGLNKCLTDFFKCLPLSPHISETVTDQVVLCDEENIYVSPAAFDSFIIPQMDIRIKHRPLVKILNSYKILTGEYHYCCRLQFTDASLQKQQIYRYRISRSILSHESQVVIDKTANAEFFHDISNASINNFLPLIQGKHMDTWAGRIIESGAKANNHILITGESASGKSFMMIRTAAYLAELGERVILFDSSESNTEDELKKALSEEFVNKYVEIYDLEKDKFPIDPFSISGLNRKDSKANYIFNILRSVLYDVSGAQNAKLKTLIYENIDTLEKNGTVPPDNIQKILIKDGSTISSLRDKLIPLLISLNGNIDYGKTWADYLESNKKILVFSVNTTFEKKGEKRFDIILASLYQYHIKHKYSPIWLCIDEIYDQNLKEDGVINKIFTQGRKSLLNIILKSK